MCNLEMNKWDYCSNRIRVLKLDVQLPEHRSCMDSSGTCHIETTDEEAPIHNNTSICAGQALWQNGIVQRHHGTFKITLDKLLLEGIQKVTPDGLPAMKQQVPLVVSEACQVKNSDHHSSGGWPGAFCADASMCAVSEAAEGTEGNCLTSEE